MTGPNKVDFFFIILFEKKKKIFVASTKYLNYCAYFVKLDFNLRKWIS